MSSRRHLAHRLGLAGQLAKVVTVLDLSSLTLSRNGQLLTSAGDADVLYAEMGGRLKRVPVLGYRVGRLLDPHQGLPTDAHHIDSPRVEGALGERLRRSVLLSNRSPTASSRLARCTAC